MKRRFAEMVNDPERTTLYEGWGIGPNGFPGGTTNHAWSGGGLTILSQYVCGVAPTEVGYKAYRIAPQPTGLKEAETLVPTVKGNIKVSFKDDEKNFQLQVSSPQGSQASIVESIHQEKNKTLSITMKNGGDWIFNAKK